MTPHQLYCFWHQNHWPYQKSNRQRLDRILHYSDWLSEIKVQDPLHFSLFQLALPSLELEWGRLLGLGISILTVCDEAFPICLLHLNDPPLCIQIKGQKEAVHHWLEKLMGWNQSEETPFISVVGSRNPTPATSYWIKTELRDFLKKTNRMTVSGGARGVDQEVHLLSSQLGLPTLVILPSGLGQIYPACLKRWESMILEQGGIFLSEFAFDTVIHKRFFHHRNRLIVAFSRGTLVVQAQIKSGSMITAFQAANNGRDVYVVPGHPTDTYYSGSLQLLSQGATLVRSAHDLCDFMA